MHQALLRGRVAVKFIDMASRAGIDLKPLYYASEVSAASGIPVRTINDEMRAGRLKYFLPKGRRQGRLIAPEWFDQWLEAGING